MSWTPEQIEHLRQLWREGLSASQIAKRIGGVTRAAVCGQRLRLGLPARKAGVRIDLGRRPVIAKGELGKSKVRKSPIPKHRLVALANPERVVEEDLPGGVEFMALQPGMCRWPISSDRPHRFCGCPQKEGLSYCADHAARAYVPPLQKHIRAPREYSVWAEPELAARAA